MTNAKNTKRALLTSVLALVLCFTMLLGSTFAWFTDSAASGSNVIKSGNLDIVVEYTLDGENWDDLDGANDLFQKGLWEPGHTEVVALRIKNNGSLALKYTANMNIVNEKIGKTADGKDIVLSDILVVSTLNQQANDAMGVGDITLALAFAGESRVAYENAAPFKAANVLRNDQMLLPGDAHYLIIKVDMDETIGNEANHNGTDIPEIEFGINVFATQYTHEEDSFGSTYDEDASVAAVKDMKEALKNGVTEFDFMGADINLNYGFTTAMVPAGTTVTVRNGFVNGGSYGNKVDGTIIFENCTFTNSGAYSIHFDGGKGDVIFKNCKLYGWNSFGSSLNSVSFYDSALYGNGTFALIRSYVDLHLENCFIDISNANHEDGYSEGVQAVNGAALTMVNCTKASTPADDASLEAALKDTTATEIVVNLTDDVIYDVAAWADEAMGGNVTKTIVINGNGNTITFNQTNSDWNNIVTNGAKLIINDAHLTNAGHNDGPWNRHDLNFGCAVELNNVTSDKAMAFKADATLKNVTINDANTSDTYAIWIQPNGQKIDIDGLTIDMLAAKDGRGIKIDEQYVDSAKKVTLTVKNATFKTEEKSAILVKSVAGADITLVNVDITEVAADSTNAVWVDKASAAYADLVVVTGASKIVEP